MFRYYANTLFNDGQIQIVTNICQPFALCSVLAIMEVKVFVDGVSRVVCGVTEETACQDVVIALAQALGMCT